jgi:hypothetical protein
LKVGQLTKAPRPFEVSADGRGMTGRAGLGLVAQVADRVGLTAGLGRVIGRCRAWRRHDPGKVVRDLVLTLADGGDALRHMKVLEGQPELFGDIASAATANRTIAALAGRELVLEELGEAMRAARQRVWAVGGAPPAVAAASAVEHTAASGHSGTNDEQERVWRLGLDIDGTLLICHNDDRDGLRRAAATYKRTFGTYPLLAYLDRGDGLREALVALHRSGSAGSNTAADHIEVLEMALAALPCLPERVQLVVRTDAAGATHEFLAYVRQTGAEFSVGFGINEAVRKAIRALNDDDWVAARRQDGQVREGAAVAEITHSPWINLDGYPHGCRLLVRREPLHPGAQQTLFDVPGARFTAFLTDQPDPPADLAAHAPHDYDPLDAALPSDTLASDTRPGGLAGLDLTHREHAHVEDGIRGAKDTGARNLPCATFERNAVWLQLVMMAQTVMAWTQALTLDGELRLAEPAALRYKLLHTPAKLSRSGRKMRLRIQHDWPWATQLVTAFNRLWALPLPAP